MTAPSLLKLQVVGCRYRTAYNFQQILEVKNDE